MDAKTFATESHEGQVRKYSGIPYITHPAAVAALVAYAGGTKEMIEAAWLHDVVEDCGVSIDCIFHNFGSVVANYVWYLTDQKTEGNRAARKAASRERYKDAPPEVQTIKLADIYHNLSTMVKEAPSGFLKVYKKEKELMLPYLSQGNEELYNKVKQLIEGRF